MSAPNNRLLALDVIRGITIAGMILVNNPGSWQSVYAPLQHARWHGLTPTDLVYPFFMFIMGVAIHFSLRKFDKLNTTVSLKIIRIGVADAHQHHISTADRADQLAVYLYTRVFDSL